MKNLLLLCTLLVTSLGFSQEETATDSLTQRNTLGEILITATPVQNQLQRIPAAVAVITAQNLERGDQLSVANEINKIPGIQMQQGALNTSRISIRGLGARSQYSTNRVKAYLEGIPLTTGEGETTLEDLDLSLIQNIEIIKGPASSSYGAGLGGAMLLSVIKPKKPGFSVRSNAMTGSYGLFKTGVSGLYADEQTQGFISYNHLESDGFRDNSGYNRNSITAYAKTQLNEVSSLSFFGNYIRLKAYIPSSINANDFREAPQKAAFTWAQAQGYESYDKILAGLSYDWQINAQNRWTTSLFTNTRDGYEPRPFDILDENSLAFGIRSNLNSEFSIFQLNAKSSIGVEYFDEHYKAELFENNYESNPGNGSIQGNRFADQEQDRKYLNLFAQIQLKFTERLTGDFGLNYNHSRYILDDILNENGTDNSGTYTYPRIFLPQAGVTYEAFTDKFIYATVARGFSLPTVAETLTPEGAINPEIKPETGVNYELGFKGQWLQKRLYTEVAFYTVQVDNLLVAERVGNDQYVGRNAGKTDHNGVEFFAQYRDYIGENLMLQPYASVALNDYSFEKFTDRDVDYSGNDLTGVADRVINLGLDLSWKSWSFNTNYRHTGSIPLDDANSIYSDSYNVVNLRSDYAFELGKTLDLNVFGGINNLFDADYAAQILPNATGFGGSLPRYYYPGEPINFYLGLNFQF
ncbi:TonB-dependent receptor family protein [Leeuwenhoekiella parthenopeia]|uniref:TonB-dependent receptor n=1 Tax=Leeuwenhoekiella parthenopeia TaxID=2890320 RepID=A0ABS8GWD8_9FLAO|nr:TonB-dependent receptor [Leeuwenhoekiella parthenopeia]MCC4214340.1 TonB-dependent receptor [Leeuwenhoekiella parthenopeia]